jgi:hypothetical protein
VLCLDSCSSGARFELLGQVREGVLPVQRGGFGSWHGRELGPSLRPCSLPARPRHPPVQAPAQEAKAALGSRGGVPEALGLRLPSALGWMWPHLQAAAPSTGSSAAQQVRLCGTPTRLRLCVSAACARALPGCRCYCSCLLTAVPASSPPVPAPAPPTCLPSQAAAAAREPCGGTGALLQAEGSVTLVAVAQPFAPSAAAKVSQLAAVEDSGTHRGGALAGLALAALLGTLAPCCSPTLTPCPPP